MKTKFVFLFSYVYLFVMSSTFSQDTFCGTCSGENCKSEVDYMPLPLLRASGANFADTTELLISFSHSKQLENRLGLDSLLRAYPRFVDSLNVCFWNSGIRVKVKHFTGENVVIDAPQDSIANILTAIRGSTPPYDIINDNKLCNNIHINFHMVQEFNDGISGIAAQARSSGISKSSSNTVCQWKKQDIAIIGLIRHEIGHLLGMGHDDEHFRIGAFDNSRAYVDSTRFRITIMWWTLIQEQFAAFRYSHDSIADSGLRLGDPNHDNVNTANAILPFYQSYYQSNRIITSSQGQELCVSDITTLSISVDRLDETKWEGLYEWEGAYLSNTDQSEVVFTPEQPGQYTITCKTLDQTFDNNCVWKQDQITIIVLEDDLVLDQATICEGEVYELPDGELLGEAGTYEVVFEGAASNGCDQILNLELEVLANELRDTIINLVAGEEFMLVDGTVVSGEGIYTAVEIGGAANGCDVVWTYTAMESSSTEESLKEIRIFPNPIEDYLYLSSAQNSDLELKLFTHEGKLVLSDTNPVKIDATDFASGTYILELVQKNKAQRIVKKIIIK